MSCHAVKYETLYIQHPQNTSVFDKRDMAWHTKCLFYTLLIGVTLRIINSRLIIVLLYLIMYWNHVFHCQSDFTDFKFLWNNNNKRNEWFNWLLMGSWKWCSMKIDYCFLFFSFFFVSSINRNGDMYFDEIVVNVKTIMYVYY